MTAPLTIRLYFSKSGSCIVGERNSGITLNGSKCIDFRHRYVLKDRIRGFYENLEEVFIRGKKKEKRSM